MFNFRDFSVFYTTKSIRNKFTLKIIHFKDKNKTDGC